MFKSFRVVFTVILAIAVAILLTSRQPNGAPSIMILPIFGLLVMILVIACWLWRKEVREVIKDLLAQEADADAVDWRQKEDPDRRQWINGLQDRPREPRCMAIREGEPTQPLF